MKHAQLVPFQVLGRRVGAAAFAVTLGATALGAAVDVDQVTPEELGDAWRLCLGLVEDSQESAIKPEENLERIELLQHAELGAVVESLKLTLPSPATSAQLREAIGTLVARAEMGALSPVVELVNDFDEVHQQSRGTGRWLTEQLMSFSEMNGAASRLQEITDDLPVILRPSAEFAELDAGSTRPLQVWSTLNINLLQIRLDGLQRLNFKPDVAEGLVVFLEGLLGDPEDRIQAKTATNLARLRSTRSVESIVSRLNTSGPRAIRSFEHALLDLTQLRTANSTEDWIAWWEAESKWQAEEFPLLRDHLVEGSPAEFAQAQRLCQQHPASAWRFAEALGEAIRFQDHGLALRALSVLKQLDDATARKILEQAKDDHREWIRVAAGGQ